MWKKAMDKVVVEEIKEDKQNEREDKKLKRATYVGSTNGLSSSQQAVKKTS
jgi:hypothetical protein